MDIPKYIGVVYDFTFDGDPHSTHIGNDEAAVLRETLAEYNDLINLCREEGMIEEQINEIGWDVYKSTRATANSPA